MDAIVPLHICVHMLVPLSVKLLISILKAK